MILVLNAACLLDQTSGNRVRIRIRIRNPNPNLASTCPEPAMYKSPRARISPTPKHQHNKTPVHESKNCSSLTISFPLPNTPYLALQRSRLRENEPTKRSHETEGEEGGWHAQHDTVPARDSQPGCHHRLKGYWPAHMLTAILDISPRGL